jgi:hypothetical protein
VRVDPRIGPGVEVVARAEHPAPELAEERAAAIDAVFFQRARSSPDSRPPDRYREIADRAAADR